MIFFIKLSQSPCFWKRSVLSWLFPFNLVVLSELKILESNEYLRMHENTFEWKTHHFGNWCALFDGNDGFIWIATSGSPQIRWMPSIFFEMICSCIHHICRRHCLWSKKFPVEHFFSTWQCWLSCGSKLMTILLYIFDSSLNWLLGLAPSSLGLQELASQVGSINYPLALMVSPA